MEIGDFVKVINLMWVAVGVGCGILTAGWIGDWRRERRQAMVRALQEQDDLRARRIAYTQIMARMVANGLTPAPRVAAYDPEGLIAKYAETSGQRADKLFEEVTGTNCRGDIILRSQWGFLYQLVHRSRTRIIDAADGGILGEVCAHLGGSEFPDADRRLAEFLMIRTDEPRYWQLVNFGTMGHDPTRDDAVEFINRQISRSRRVQ